MQKNLSNIASTDMVKEKRLSKSEHRRRSKNNQLQKQPCNCA